MSLAELEQLLAERQRVRVAHHQLQDHANDRDFADQVEVVGGELDRIDHQFLEVIENLNAERIRIPGDMLYDIAESALERLMRRDPDAGDKLHAALEAARWMK